VCAVTPRKREGHIYREPIFVGSPENRDRFNYSNWKINLPRFCWFGFVRFCSVLSSLTPLTSSDPTLLTIPRSASDNALTSNCLLPRSAPLCRYSFRT
jgi:hypothetical protein